jgi:4-hydroxy-tetrahydrodipicolinate reductase
MKIALLGYGKMGQEIERIAEKMNHTIHLIIDSEDDWDKLGLELKNADIAIDFSMPSSVVDNIYRCFEANVPVVVGTTGWYEELDEIRNTCIEQGQTLFYATNFSIGVNLFFQLNSSLAKLMSERSDYEISIEETHHIHKKDAPSGTAIVLANDILQSVTRLGKWVNEKSENPSEIGIKSFRKENEPGTHKVRYESENDIIEITHTAKNRRGFATGAVMAAEWLSGKKGWFEMKDMLFHSF